MMRHHVNFKLLFPLVIQSDNSAFGPLNGRVAQRMARGRFVLDGKVYHTYINDGKNAIHGMILSACSDQRFVVPAIDCAFAL